MEFSGSHLIYNKNKESRKIVSANWVLEKVDFQLNGLNVAYLYSTHLAQQFIYCMRGHLDCTVCYKSRQSRLYWIVLCVNIQSRQSRLYWIVLCVNIQSRQSRLYWIVLCVNIQSRQSRLYWIVLCVNIQSRQSRLYWIVLCVNIQDNLVCTGLYFLLIFKIITFVLACISY